MALWTQTRTRLPGRVTRWGFFVVALGLGTALLVSSIISYMGERALLETVIHAQADGLGRQFGRVLQETEGRPSEDDLEQFLAEHEADGVRHVAIFGLGRALVVEAGTSQGIHPPRPGQIRVVGDRVQAAFGPERRDDEKGKGPGAGKDGEHRPPRPWGKAAPPRPPPGPLGHGPPPPGPPPQRPIIVIEFLPEAALALQARTVRDLLVGVAVAIALMVAAAIFWRLSLRAQAVEDHLSRQRHLAALGEMSAVLAHEIRNPLAALKGHAQLLAERVQGDAALERKTARIVDASQRLETLTHSLLDFARIGTVSHESVDPVALLRRCADACTGTVEVVDTGAPATWALDETRIEQVLGQPARQCRASGPRLAHRGPSARRGQLARIRGDRPGSGDSPRRTRADLRALPHQAHPRDGPGAWPSRGGSSSYTRAPWWSPMHPAGGPASA